MYTLLLGKPNHIEIIDQAAAHEILELIALSSNEGSGESAHMPCPDPESLPERVQL